MYVVGCPFERCLGVCVAQLIEVYEWLGDGEDEWGVVSGCWDWWCLVGWGGVVVSYFWYVRRKCFVVAVFCFSGCGDGMLVVGVC